VDRQRIVIVATAIVAASVGAAVGGYLVRSSDVAGSAETTEPNQATGTEDDVVAKSPPLAVEPAAEPPAYFAAAGTVGDSGTPLMKSIPRKARKRLEAGGAYEAAPVRWPDSGASFTVVWAEIDNFRYDEEVEEGTDAWLDSNDCALRSRTVEGQKEVLRWTYPVDYWAAECDMVLYSQGNANLVAVTNSTPYAEGGESWGELFDYRELRLGPDGQVQVNRTWGGDPKSDDCPDWVAEAAIVDARGRALRASRDNNLHGFESGLEDLEALNAPPDMVREVRGYGSTLRFDEEFSGAFEFGMEISTAREGCVNSQGSWEAGRTLVTCKFAYVTYGAGLCDGMVCSPLLITWNPATGWNPGTDAVSFSGIVRHFDKKYGSGRLFNRGKARVKAWRIDEQRLIEVTLANVFGHEMISISIKHEGH
jgi:hypothetical protein